MKSKPFYVTRENFYVFIKRVVPNFNLKNTEYVEQLMDEFFSEGKESYCFSTAEIIFNRMLSNRVSFSDSISKTTIKYWNSLGYYDKNEIILCVIKYIKEDDKKYIIFYNDDKKIKEWVEQFLGNFNFERDDLYQELKDFVFGDEVCLRQQDFFNKCKRYIVDIRGSVRSRVSKNYWEARGFDESFYKEYISTTQKERSPRCVDYYLSRVFDENESNKRVSELQSKYSKKGKSHVEYWLNKGFDEDEAKRLALECGRLASVWTTDFWISRGHTEEEAKKKILEYNPSSPFFVGYKNDVSKYMEKCKKMSDSAKRRNKENREWMKRMMNNIVEGKLKTGSKAENEFFDYLIKYVNPEVKHEQYFVVIPEELRDKSVNSYFYACDGFIETEDGIIIIEYDGIIYHKDEIDEKRDNEIMMIDENVLGFIHVKQETRCGSSWLKIKCLQTNEAIQEIRNTTKSRIIL